MNKISALVFFALAVSMAAAVGTFSGNVNDAIGGAAIAGATVTFTNVGNGSVYTTVANGAGAYTIDVPTTAAPGIDYTPRASAPGYTMQTLPNAKLADGQSKNRAFTLTAFGGIVQGTVVGPDGFTPVQNAVATIYVDNTTNVGNTTTTNAAGFYSMAMQGGTHRMEVTNACFTTQTRTVTVPFGGTTTQNFQCPSIPVDEFPLGTVIPLLLGVATVSIASRKFRNAE